MLPSFLCYLAALVTFVVVDMIWLGSMVPRFYRPLLGDLLAPAANLAPAVAFYVIYPAGLVFFAVQPALKSGSLGAAAAYGALFGFFTYATYDLTNHATLRGWTLPLTVVDVAWGTMLAALTSVVAYWVGGRLGGLA